MMRTHWSWLMIPALLASVAWAGIAHAQVDGDSKPLRGFTIDPDLFGGPRTDKEYQISAFIVPQREGSPALLAVRVELAPKWHIYSITQPKGGPLRSKIELDTSPDYKLLGDFAPIAPPKIRDHDIPKAWQGVRIEEHYDEVTWVAPISISPEVDPLRLAIRGNLDGQVCIDGGACIGLSLRNDTEFTARIGSPDQIASIPAPQSVQANPQPDAVGEFIPPKGNPTIRGFIQPQVVAPGDVATLVIEVEPQPSWHVYARVDEIPANLPYRPTLIAIANSSGLSPRPPVADSAVIEKGDLRYYEGPTTWTIEIPIPADAPSGGYNIAGQLGYQVCTDSSCDSPRAVGFDGTITVGQQSVAGSVPLAFTESKYGLAMKALETRVAWAGEAPANVAATSSGNNDRAVAVSLVTLLPYILASLVGGLILNVMPCVLPVIGLKILSFAEQSGQNRMKAFGLNAWYSAGVLSIFFVLASIAVGVGMLGQHYVQGSIFQSTPFIVSMIALMVAMALSFLGVWEIPIPGFTGGGSASKLVEQEGVMGAFCKGAFATILATPCSGPLLGPVFGFAIAQPWWVTYLVFGSIGLGMSAPYLLIGLFPKLIAFLPKPGAWMETFKQLMAFFLLGTVVYMFYILPDRFTVPALTVVVGVWFACWLIGRTPLTASSGKRATAWLGGAGTVAATVVIAFTLLVPFKTGEAMLFGQKVKTKQTNHLTWYMYSPDILQRAAEGKKTVMVDFTANWCPSCKWNMANAIDKKAVAEVVKQQDVVPLLADLSEPSEEINAKLKELQAASIPVLAIFPADRPHEPIILRDVITQQQLLDALKQAGDPPAESDASTRTAMMPSS